MKNMKKLIYICLAITLITFSCMIEKRMYNSGYHVKWNGKDFNSEKNSFIATEDDKNEKITESKTTILDRINSSKVEPSFDQPKVENTFSNATSFHSTLQKVAGEKRKSIPSKIASVQKENSIKKSFKQAPKDDSNFSLMRIILIVILAILIITLFNVIDGLLGGLLSLILAILLILLILRWLSII